VASQEGPSSMELVQNLDVVDTGDYFQIRRVP
jgi:hypothetical protein